MSGDSPGRHSPGRHSPGRHSHFVPLEVQLIHKHRVNLWRLNNSQGLREDLNRAVGHFRGLKAHLAN